MDGFSEQVLSRLPLADAVLSALSWVSEESFLAEVFAEHRGESYEKELGFGTMVHLIADALLEHQGSARQAMLHGPELTASRQAAYGKLRRIPISLSNGFLAQASSRLREVFPAAATQSLPASLRAFDVIAVDGKKIKKAAKRLKPTRDYSGTPLGGKALVALDLRRNLVIAMNAHLDGEKNDAPLIPDLLPQVRKHYTRRRLWVADRQFCDLTQPRRFAADNDAFLIRYHPKNSFHADRKRPAQTGVDSHGRKYREEWGHLGSAKGGKQLYVRRITLKRKGEEDIILVTDLLDAKQYPAADLLDVYRLRWGIERVFQQVTEVFHLQHLISSTPQGTIFQCSFCLLLYNLIQLVRSYVAGAQRRKAATISSEMLFYDIHRELISLSVLAEPETVAAYFQPPVDADDLTNQLHNLLETVWQDYWSKSPPKKKPPGTSKKQTIQGGHTSLYRMIKAAKTTTT